MTVADLRKLLVGVPDDYEVMTKDLNFGGSANRVDASDFEVDAVRKEFIVPGTWAGEIE